MTQVRHRTTTVEGHQIFYREAGPVDAPAIVLLHGYPSSSFMFRELIPHLADSYHVIAPDHLGFGLSAAPLASEFAYTFDSLAGITSGLLDQLGLDRYAIFVHDYGAPIGWRLALEHPERISAVITQNGNGYEDGFVDSFWSDVWAYGADPDVGPEGVDEPVLRLGVRRRPRSRYRTRRPRCAEPRCHSLAVPARRTRSERGQSGYMGARRRTRFARRQRRGSTRAVPRLREQSPPLPATARVLRSEERRVGKE